MNPIVRIVLVVLGLGVLVGGFVGYKMWNKPHRDVAGAQADVKLQATDLFNQFSTDEATANGQYLDKIVQVCGTVAQVSNENDVITVQLDAGDLMGGVLCELDNLTEHSRTDFQSGETVCFKGICTGYLTDVVLNRCVEVSQ
ncbi:MAG: hypothetical protein H6563_04305 [Lewinellaceae bacterium]|nr:hypothetical protein [Lewinellaceae bacterium]